VLGVASEAVANVWLSAILKACLYANLKHELILSGEGNQFLSEE
jgi:hypothetical protein